MAKTNKKMTQKRRKTIRKKGGGKIKGDGVVAVMAKKLEEEIDRKKQENQSLTEQQIKEYLQKIEPPRNPE